MSWRRPGRGWWAAALGLTLFVGIFPQFALGALGPQLRDDLGVSPADLGLVFAALYVAGVVGSPLAGPIVDRLGPRRSCVGLQLTVSAALLAASFATGRVGLIAAMLPAGAAMAFANPGTNRWAAAASRPRVQAQLVSIAQAGVQAGALVAGALASAVALGLDWRGVLRIAAGLAVIGAFLAVRAPADDRSREAAAAPPRPVTDTSARAPRGALLALAVYAGAMGAGTAVVFAYLPTFAVDVGGMSVAAAGATASIYGGTALLCRLAIGAVLRDPDRHLRRLLVGFALGAAVAILVLMAGGVAPMWILVGAVLFGATGTTWPVVAFLAVVRISPPGAAGRATGWMAAAFYLGLWLSPPLAGLVIAEVGYSLAWAGSVAAYLLAVMPAATIGGRRRSVPVGAA
ncbi:MAG: MFS transporter [Nitriliruptoraceae bacterium]